jgi:hypothetical protein
MNTELKNLWKDAVMAYFEAVSRHMPEGNEKNHHRLQ